MPTPEFDFVTVFNAIEAVWWFSCGGLMWRFSQRHRDHHRTARFTAIALFVFGASDVIEVFTGAWWRPWWLAVMKIVCGLIIITGGWTLWKQRKLWQKIADSPASTD